MIGRPRWRAFRAATLAAAAAVLLASATFPLRAATKKRKPRRPEPTAVPRPADPDRVAFQTADGVTIVGSWKPLLGSSAASSSAAQGAPVAPAVLLLHDFSRERREWEVLSHDLLVHGLASLAIDLRGHGESTRGGGGEAVRLSPRLLRDPNGFPRDVKAALSWLHQRSPAVGVLGLSTGANLAILATANGWAEAAVAVSANSDSLQGLAGPLSFTPKGTLFLASVLDPGREASARKLLAVCQEPKKLLLFPGAAHNMTLLAENLEARRVAFEWLAARLGAVSPTTVGPGPGGTFLSPMVGAGAVPPTPVLPPTPTPGPR